MRPAIAGRPWIPTRSNALQVHPDVALCATALEAVYQGLPCPDPDWQPRVLETWRGVQLAAFVHHRERSILLVIPGTNERADWADGNLWLTPERIAGLPGYWRGGFRAGGEWAYYQVRHQFARDLDAGWSLLITGHSYGAAAAVAAAAYAARLRTTLRGVLTFAGPRCCSAGARDWLQERCGHVAQRYVYGVDIVPHAVPPMIMRHCFEPVFVTSSGDARPRLPAAGELWRAVCARGLQLVGHHSIRRYASWALSLRPLEVAVVGEASP
jgi:hypothetical protein